MHPFGLADAYPSSSACARTLRALLARRPITRPVTPSKNRAKSEGSGTEVPPEVEPVEPPKDELPPDVDPPEVDPPKDELPPEVEPVDPPEVDPVEPPDVDPPEVEVEPP
jgi:hypothetical protein